MAAGSPERVMPAAGPTIRNRVMAAENLRMVKSAALRESGQKVRIAADGICQPFRVMYKRIDCFTYTMKGTLRVLSIVIKIGFCGAFPQNLYINRNTAGRFGVSRMVMPYIFVSVFGGDLHREEIYRCGPAFRQRKASCPDCLRMLQ